MSPLRNLALVMVLLHAPSASEAYSTMTSPPSVWRMDWSADGVHWVLNNAGCPDLSLSETEAALEGSFQAWEDVDCSLIRFIYDGTTDQTTTGMDGVNLLVFRTGGWLYGPGALGVTGFISGGRQIHDADIEFNSLHYTWTVGASSGAEDLPSVAIHEMGHFLGLDHSDDTTAIMFPYIMSGTVGSLSDDDRAGVCYLYPSGEGCSDERPCPTGYDCRAGDCVTTGGGAVCDICMGHDECGGAADFCVPYGDGSDRCGRSCSTNENCEFAPGCETRTCECQDMSGGGGRQCVATSCAVGPECSIEDPCADGFECVDGECVPRGCTELGEPCGSPDECCSNICFDGVCSQPCDWLRPGESCPSGFYCAIQECGIGHCVRGEIEGGDQGDPCERNEDCSTGYCASTGGPPSCSYPCDPDGIDTCPDDWSCTRIGASYCGLCACQIGLIGDPCRARDQCASGLCATKSGERRCSRFCGDGDTCPPGYDCLPAGDISICWPGAGGLNAPCTVDEECVDGICRAGSCTRPCENNCSCAAGYECGALQGETVCVLAIERRSRGCECAAAGSRPRLAFLLLLACLVGVTAALRRGP